MDTLKTTPLIEEYKNYGGKVVDFAGYRLPVQFKGILEEHEAVREKAGLFDVSHMGEIIIKGKDAETFVNYLITNDVKTLEDNDVLYTFMCNETGGVVDDLLVYRFSKEEYFLVVNASNMEKDYKWMLDNKGNYDVELNNISDEFGQLALQGPKAQEILQKLVSIDLSEIGFFKFKRNVEVKGKKCLVSRTGYTGEDGFEIYTEPKNLVELWRAILEEGKDLEVEPIGLGARDTLRFEATLPLYGNEMDATITPLEMGFGFFVKLNKDNFIGRDALVKQKSDGVKRKLVGFELLDKGIARHGYRVIVDGKDIGHVTTGYMSPTLKKNIGFALIDEKYSAFGNEIFIKVRNRELKAVVINKKFYSKKTQK